MISMKDHLEQSNNLHKPMKMKDQSNQPKPPMMMKDLSELILKTLKD